MSVSATNNSSQSSNAADVTASGYDAFGKVGIEDFLKLMTTELQNQDPLNPMDNTQMLAQIGQIREIASNDSLTNTLESVMLGQNMSTASGMLGQTVEAMDNTGAKFTGEVIKVTIADGVPTLLCTETVPEYVDVYGKTVPEAVAEHAVKLKNVYSVIPADQVEKIDPTLLPQQLSTASGLIKKMIIATEGEEILEVDDGDGNLVEKREKVAGVAGIVEKTVVEDGQAKVQILIPAPEATEENPDPKDKRYVVALTDIEQIVPEAEVEKVDPYRLTEKLAIGASMVGRKVVGQAVDGENTITLGGRVQQVYVQDGEVMLAVDNNEKDDEGNPIMYGLGLDEVTNVYNYTDPYEVTN